MDYKKLIQEELNKVSESKFAKKTDKQLLQYDSLEYKNGAKLGGKIGGKISGTIQRDNGLLKKFHSEGGKAVGKIQGKKNIESGLISELGKKNCLFNNREQVCPYCGIKTKGVGYQRWHGERCKHKK